MYNENIRPVSMPVSMPASAGLYAGVGRSLCRRRPVSMPANPFSTVSPCPPGVFFGKNSVPKKTYLLNYTGGDPKLKCSGITRGSLLAKLGDHCK